MVQYEDGKIYKLTGITPEGKELIYIGSTTNMLCRRLSGHVTTFKRNSNITSSQIIALGNYEITLLELYPCSCKDELTARERYYYDLYDCVNNRRPKIENFEKKEYITQYRLENGDKIKQYRLENGDKIKRYRLENLEKIKENAKQYRLENAEEINERNKKYRLKNPDQIKKYRIENAEKNKENAKQYRMENAEKIKENKKLYRLENADKIRKQEKQYRLNKKLKSNIKENIN
jgi:hypothetical protein